MSKKHDKYRQVRLEPDAVRKLENIQAKFPVKISIVALVNAFILQGDESKVFPTPQSN